MPSKLALFVVTFSITAAAQQPPQSTSGTGFTGAPYSAKEIVVTTRNILKESKAQETSEVILRRDNAGRTREDRDETSQEGYRIHSVIIKDPVAGYYLKWSEGQGMPSQATIWPMNAKSRLTGPVPQNRPSTLPGKVTSCGDNCTREVLAPQQINGIYSEGSKMNKFTETATGKQPTLSNELWVSPELRIITRHIMVDAQYKRTETNVVDVIQQEPDPLLFQAPPGFMIRDMRQPENASQR